MISHYLDNLYIFTIGWVKWELQLLCFKLHEYWEDNKNTKATFLIYVRKLLL